MMREIKFKRRVLTHGLVVATTILTCTAVRADHENEDTRVDTTHRDTTHGDKTASFIHKAMKGGQMEVQLGQLAQQKGQSQAVKDLGQTLVKDHTQANQQLQQLASNLPGNSQDQSDRAEHKDAKHDQTLNKLQNQSGAEFDKAFVRMAIRDHKKDISEFEKARAEVTDAQLRSFIDQTLPKLRNHLQMAQTAAREVGVDAASIASERDEDADTASGAAAAGVSGTSNNSATQSDKDRSSLDRDHLNGATESDASGTVNQNNPSATVQGNIGDREFKANADIDRSDKSVNVDTSTDKSNKVFQKGDGKVLGLPTDKNDGKFLGIIPDPKKKHHEAEVNVNSDSDSSSVGTSATGESGTSSSSDSK